jgi:hypothetical protein
MQLESNSSRRIQFIFAYLLESKLMVTLGISQNGYTNSTEIIDLNDSGYSGNYLEPFPKTLDLPVAGFLDKATPLVCGNLILKY